MPLDFSPLQAINPAGAFFRGQEQAREQQQQNVLLQRRQMEFEQAQEDRRRRMEQEGQFRQVADLVRQHGLDPDDPKVLGEFSQAALLSGQPQLATFVTSMAERAAKRRAAAAEAKQIGEILGPQTAAPGALQNALARPAPATNALTAPQPDLLAGTPFSIGGVAAPQAPAPAPIARVPDNTAKIAELERQRDALEALGTPNALAQAKRLDRQLEKLQPKENATSPVGRLIAERDALPVGDPRRATYDAAIQKATTHQEPQKVDVKVQAYVPASEAAQREYITSVSKERDALRNAPDTLANVEKARGLVSGAKSFMGAGGEPLLKAASFLNNRLGFNIDTKGVADATELRTRLFEGIIDNLRRLDSQPSQEQQRIMQEALGTLGTDPNALPRILDKIEETVRARVTRHNEDVTDAEKRGVKFPFKPQIKLPERKSPAPDASAIPGASPTMAASAATTPLYARNPSTGARIMSTDGGNTWVPAR